jgi:hypothetical protein
MKGAGFLAGGGSGINSQQKGEHARSNPKSLAPLGGFATLGLGPKQERGAHNRTHLTGWGVRMSPAGLRSCRRISVAKVLFCCRIPPRRGNGR